MSAESTEPAEPAEPERTETPRPGRVIREGGKILSALITGLCTLVGTLGAAMIISGSVEKWVGTYRGLEGNEDIGVEVQGFNSDNRTERRAIAHNFGRKAGILLPDVVIIVRNKDDKELTRLRKSLNAGPEALDEPFTLPAQRGWRYFLGDRDQLPEEAKRCVLEYKAWRSAREIRPAKTPPFDCHND